MEWEWRESLIIFHISADLLTCIVHFCKGGGWGWGTKLVIFCGRHKCMTPKWFKITTNAIIRGSSFFFNIKAQVRYILNG